jgi:hypothetical protein
MRGRPFFYFAYGAAVSEVAVDTLTGETQLLRVDILHDVGSSLNPAIDLGQIEGGFLQGVGWLTSEELWWNAQGQLQTHAPSTYKIPTARDWPAQATVRLLDQAPNREHTIYRSKAVGEPPLMLAISVLHAIRDAVASCGPSGVLPELAGAGDARGRAARRLALCVRKAAGMNAPALTRHAVRRCGCTARRRVAVAAARLATGADALAAARRRCGAHRGRGRARLRAARGRGQHAGQRLRNRRHHRRRPARVAGAGGGAHIAYRSRLAPARMQRLVLGAELGQCCGGVVELWMERYTRADLALLRARVRGGAAVRLLAARSRARASSARSICERPGTHDRSAAAPREQATPRVRTHASDQTVCWNGWMTLPPLWLYGAGHVGQALARIADGTAAAPDLDRFAPAAVSGAMPDTVQVLCSSADPGGQPWRRRRRARFRGADPQPRARLCAVPRDSRTRRFCLGGPDRLEEQGGALSFAAQTRRAVRGAHRAAGVSDRHRGIRSKWPAAIAVARGRAVAAAISAQVPNAADIARPPNRRTACAQRALQACPQQL